MKRHSGRLIVATGKGGVGKTTIAAALGVACAARGDRVLIIETASDGALPSLFGRGAAEDGEIRTLADRLSAVRLSPRQLVEDYFSSLLRFSFLSQRLFESSSFNALTAAAPGISEFLLLERIVQWLDGNARRRAYDVVILDGPATGHAIKLLRTPRNFLAMVPAGPLASSATRMSQLLANHRQTRVVIVAIPEELSVQETIETYRALHDELGVPMARPIINRMFPQRFNRDEIEKIIAAPPDDDLISAAKFAIARRQQAERNVNRLKRALGVTPLQLAQVFSDRVEVDDLSRFGERLFDDVAAT